LCKYITQKKGKIFRKIGKEDSESFNIPDSRFNNFPPEITFIKSKSPSSFHGEGPVIIPLPTPIQTPNHYEQIHREWINELDKYVASVEDFQKRKKYQINREFEDINMKHLSMRVFVKSLMD
jgi:hypothetical protein